MKLVKARIRNFRSAEDSGVFEVGALTCLVGKNEAGKTAVLSALYGVKPFGKQFAYDKVRDYPRRYLTRYAERHGGKDAEVTTTTWELSPDDVAAVASVLGEGALVNAPVEITTHYGGHQTWYLHVDENKVRSTLLKQNGVEAQELAKFSKTPFANLVAEIEAQPEPSEALKAAKKADRHLPQRQPGVGRHRRAIRTAARILLHLAF